MEPEAFGKYTLTGMLGVGGMARVYRAVLRGAMGFEKEVALKRIKSYVKLDKRYLKALINEARLGGQLRHRNIVEVYEFDRVGEEYYLAMEYVRGWTLREIIRDCSAAKQPIPPSIALQLCIEVCCGLDHAHSMTSRSGASMNLVHRDLKPGNVIVSGRGEVKIMDFGIAKADSNLFQTTAAAITKGTPLYMSPEQVEGSTRLTCRSDIFSLGSILYELVFLHPLFAGDHALEVLHRVIVADIEQAVVTASERHPGLEVILRRSLARKPESRYRDATEMVDDLRGLLDRIGPSPTIVEWLARYQRIRAGDAGAPDGIPAVGPDDPTQPFTDPDQGPAAQPPPIAEGGVGTREVTREFVATAIDDSPASAVPIVRPRRRWLVPALAALMTLIVGGALLGTVVVVYLVTEARDRARRSGPEPTIPAIAATTDDDSAGDGLADLEGGGDQAMGEGLADLAGAPEEETPSSTPPPPPPQPAPQPDPKADPVETDRPTATVPQRSKLYINSVPWAEVYLDGQLLMRTPIIGREIDPGHHEARVVCGTCSRPQESTVTFDVAAGEAYRNTSFRFQM